MRDLIVYLQKVGAEHPKLQADLQGIYELAVFEVGEGSSKEHEIELAYGAVKDLLKGE